MNEAIYRARMEIFKTLDLPVSRADVRRLRRRQAWKLAVWEIGLRALFGFKRLLDIVGALAGLILLAFLAAYYFLVLHQAVLKEIKRKKKKSAGRKNN